jgi:hypothetical protein
MKKEFYKAFYSFSCSLKFVTYIEYKPNYKGAAQYRPIEFYIKKRYDNKNLNLSEKQVIFYRSSYKKLDQSDKDKIKMLQYKFSTFTKAD